MADKPKPKKKSMTQFQRYLEAAKEHGVDPSGKALRETLGKIARKKG